jgi:hypothetical protein
MTPKGYFQKPKSFEGSFASHPKSMYWNYQDNGNIRPEDVKKGSGKKFWFNCDKCHHDFETTTRDISRNNWCPYCCYPPQKLCEDENCQECYEKSFKSHPRSQYWDYKKNKNMIPRQVFKSCGKKFWFNCDRCHHDFETMIRDISKNNWCPYCCFSPLKICEDDDCKECYEKSFQSHPRSQYWNYEKNEKITPRQVFKGSSKKYWFICEKGHHFKTYLKSIYHRNHWCNVCCLNKGETCLEDLCRTHDHIIKYNKRSIRCIDKHNNNISRNLIPDMIITLSNNFELMVELDGEQHFNKDHYFYSINKNIDFKNQVCRDLCKNNYARENNMSLLRISYLEYDRIEYFLNITIDKILLENKNVYECSNPKLYNNLREYAYKHILN